MPEPRTINLPGSGTDTQEYTLAPGLLQYVQSVYVELDNSAGADARPTVTISEQSGVVIAKKRQGESIPAGDTGSATWALRLDDERAAAAAAASFHAVYILTMGNVAGDVLVMQQASAGDATIVTAYQMAVEIVGVWTVPANAPMTLEVFNIDAVAHTSQLVQANVQQIGAATREVVQGNANVIPGVTIGNVTFDTVISGAGLLNLANTAVPKFVNAGTYAVCATVATF